MRTLAESAVPPGPPSPWRGLPLLRTMSRDYLAFTASLHRRYGDLAFVRIGPEAIYHLGAPALVREAMVDHADDLVRRERGREVLARTFGNGLLVAEGAEWQRQRRLLQPGFAPKRVAGYARLMVDAAGRALDAALPAGAAAAEVDMDALFTQLTMDVILRTLFSAGSAGEARTAAQAVRCLTEAALREMFRPFRAPTFWPGQRRIREANTALRGLIAGQIAARRALPAADAPQDDLLAMLLAARDTDGGGALADDEVFDQSMVIFQAGHETTATALLWWTALLARDREAAARAHDEVDAALGGRPPEPDDAARLPWLVATLKESMRLYPPVPGLMGRRVLRGFALGGHEIPAGALLRATPWVIHRDPRWFDAPEAFRPERFLPGAPPPPRGAWLPFGTGPRVCIGQHFAMLEMTLIAALLLQRSRLDAAGRPRPGLRLGVTLRPAGEVVLTLTRRT